MAPSSLLCFLLDCIMMSATASTATQPAQSNIGWLLSVLDAALLIEGVGMFGCVYYPRDVNEALR